METTDVLQQTRCYSDGTGAAIKLITVDDRVADLETLASNEYGNSIDVSKQGVMVYVRCLHSIQLDFTILAGILWFSWRPVWGAITYPADISRSATMLRFLFRGGPANSGAEITSEREIIGLCIRDSDVR